MIRSIVNHKAIGSFMTHNDNFDYSITNASNDPTKPLTSTRHGSHKHDASCCYKLYGYYNIFFVYIKTGFYNYN